MLAVSIVFAAFLFILFLIVGVIGGWVANNFNNPNFFGVEIIKAFIDEGFFVFRVILSIFSSDNAIIIGPYGVCFLHTVVCVSQPALFTIY